MRLFAIISDSALTGIAGQSYVARKQIVPAKRNLTNGPRQCPFKSQTACLSCWFSCKNFIRE